MINFVGKCLFIKNFGKKILVIGDLHFGFEEVMNNSGVFISRKMFDEAIVYLDRVFETTGEVHEVILLGDVKHSFGTIIRQEWKEIIGLLDYLKNKSQKVTIVRGNHDNVVGPLAREAGVAVVDYYLNENFCFLHGDADFAQIHDKKIKFWVLGHAHPAIKIREGVKVEKFKCFLVGDYKKKKIIIVPSFLDYGLGSDPREKSLILAWPIKLEEFEVFVVADEDLEVLNFGKLKRIA